VTILPVLLRLFHERVFFKDWLFDHECAAGRVFDVRVTLPRLAKLGVVMGSILVVTAGFIIKGEFQLDM
jgi:hypothetical protein